jgi:hypothetical protein
MFLGNKDKAIATRVYICNNRRMMDPYWSNWNRHKIREDKQEHFQDYEAWIGSSDFMIPRIFYFPSSE